MFSSVPLPLFDTHTHFDVPDFDADRAEQAQRAQQAGVQALVLVGYLGAHFDRLIQTQHTLNLAHQAGRSPRAFVAAGLHPFYILQHQPQDLATLDTVLAQQACIAVGEIGLDTFTAEMKQPSVYQAQKDLFSAQLALADAHDLPVMLHVRRAHADVLALLKHHKFRHGGIAHAFSGGLQEAEALVKLGFKLGVTGQITNPNAKRLRHVVAHMGAAHWVLETDCPDMTPLCCQQSHEHRTRNVPANLPYVLDGLAAVLNMKKDALAAKLWHNTQHCLRLDLPDDASFAH
jgi:TatD DNase family protein